MMSDKQPIGLGVAWGVLSMGLWGFGLAMLLPAVRSDPLTPPIKVGSVVAAVVCVVLAAILLELSGRARRAVGVVWIVMFAGYGWLLFQILNDHYDH